MRSQGGRGTCATFAKEIFFSVFTSHYTNDQVCEVINVKFQFVVEKMLNKMKLFGKMKIFEKIGNETSVCFRKTGHKELENMVTVNHGK